MGQHDALVARLTTLAGQLDACGQQVCAATAANFTKVQPEQWTGTGAAQFTQAMAARRTASNAVEGDLHSAAAALRAVADAVAKLPPPPPSA